MKTSLKNDHQRDIVLTKAILNLANFYDLTGKDLRHIIGLSESTITRLNQGKALIVILHPKASTDLHRNGSTLDAQK